MTRVKSAKIIFCIAALFFVMKPFLGFSMFNGIKHASYHNIFVKVFSKRKQEFTENSKYNIANVQKKLAEPLEAFVLHFALLLAAVFPLLFAYRDKLTSRNIFDLQLILSPQGQPYLLNGALLI